VDEHAPDVFETTLGRTVASLCGEHRAREALDVLAIDPALSKATPDRRAVLAMALGVALFRGLLDRVPTGSAYVGDLRAAGRRVVLDHGAVRSIRFPSGPTGGQPPGREAFARILEPLGYAIGGEYPLTHLKMTGYAFTHRDYPENLPQYFVSELDVARFSEPFQRAARRVFESTREPLGSAADALLRRLREGRLVDDREASNGLAEVARAFARWHADPSEDDYETLLAESPEAAWIATEGGAFNHAADRVANVDELAREQRALGRPIKEHVEVSASGRVRQTAYRADPVERTLRAADGSRVTRIVPGSFFEFITRDPLPGPNPWRRLDLGFDSANAQGIFAMTSAARE
jgi:PAS domain-containing protein